MATVSELSSFNPFDPAVQQCPFPYYRAMQETAPVFQVPGIPLYFVTGHELITPILRDTETFSSQFGPGEAASGKVVGELAEIQAQGYPAVSSLLTSDPPEHTRYRSRIAPYFTPRRMAELRPVVEAIVDRLFTGLPMGERFDLVERFAVPVPVEVIAHVLNVPAEKMADFKRWSDDSVASIGSIISDERRLEAARGVVEFQLYFAAQLEARRAAPIAGDLMSDLVNTVPEGEEPLSMPLMLSILQQLLTAGNETTTKAISEGVLLLAQNPDEWQRLRADPAGRAPLVTEEVLRLASPTQGMFRVVRKDTEIAGVPVPKGARVVVVYAAANRDPDVWGDDPDRFDPDRPNHKEHLAFGKGVHFCVGAPLSRLEMQVVFEQLARRVSTIEVAADAELRYLPSFVLRGLEGLPVTLTSARG